MEGEGESQERKEESRKARGRIKRLGLKVQGKETLVAKALVTLMPVHEEKLSPQG